MKKQFMRERCNVIFVKKTYADIPEMAEMAKMAEMPEMAEVEEVPEMAAVPELVEMTYLCQFCERICQKFHRFSAIRTNLLILLVYFFRIIFQGYKKLQIDSLQIKIVV